MFKGIFRSFGGRRKSNGRKAARKNIDGHHRRLRHEFLEERSMLATLTVSVNSDGALAPANSSLTLREAIAYANGSAVPGAAERSAWINETANPLGENDVIQFAPSVYGQTIAITGGNLVVTNRVTITGPSDIANRITIQKGGSSSATIGLRFQSFSLAPNNVLPADTGVFNLGIKGFETGIEVASLSSTNYNFELPLRIVGNEITDNFTGIRIDNSDIPFKIEGNRIVGTSPTAGIGIRLTNSEQTLVNLPATYEPAIGGNVIGSFARGVFVQNIDFPDLRITGNRIGVDDDLHGQNELPNGLGIDVALGATTSEVGRIDHNDIVYNQTDGIRIHETDGVVIEDNLIGANGGDGIDLNRASGNHTIRNNTFHSNGDNGVDGDGVTIHPLTSGTDASQIVISENDFLGMKPWALPIDLGEDGQDPIDINDFDPGVNHRQNHPELTSISFDGSSWVLGIELDVGGSVMGETVRFEFYRYNASLKNYKFIRQVTDQVPEQADYAGTFLFANGTELSDGDGIAMLAIVTSGPFVNDTSEISPVYSVTAPPRITDVRLDSTMWSHAPLVYPYASIVFAGKQLAPIYTQNVNQLQIVFSENVNVQKSHLTLYGSNGRVVTPLSTADGFTYVGNTATWKFNPADLFADKYRIELSTAVTDLAGKALDGEWMNLTGGTPDNFADDPTGRTFTSGDGNPGSTNNRFEFWFSLLPGDRNQNGIVDNFDLSVSGDVNGDGVSNSTDTTLVQNIINANTAISLPLRNRLVAYANRGDYNDNEIVDQSDYALWKASFGSTTNLVADGSGNSVVDAADYSPWRDNLGKYSAWYTGPIPPSSGSGSGGVPVFDPDNIPRVANVTISGSTSTHTPFSFNGPDDNLDFDGSGIQLRTVPVGAADTISITFTEDVNITADTLKLTGLRTANRPILVEFSYDLGTMTASWRFTGWAQADHYLISLSDAITDVEGNRLDGEWTNPSQFATVNAAVSKFPSGDGYAGGDFNFVMTLLPGDADLDLTLANDLSIIASNYNLQGASFTQGDFDGDGIVGQSDTVIWANNWLAGLDLQSLSLLADLNGDWLVDDDDLTILSTNLGISNPTAPQGDLDFDSDIDIDDLDLMFAQYGLELAVVS